MCEKIKPYVVSIDPGTTQSGVCIVRTEDYKPLFVAKMDNKVVFDNIMDWFDKNCYFINWMSQDVDVVIEKIQGDSFSVGATVFETCYFIGELTAMFREKCDIYANFLFRRDEYKQLCANIYARSDKGITNALTDRFAYGEKNFGKGDKKHPGWFYGFHDDIWQAYAVAVSFIDIRNNSLINNK